MYGSLLPKANGGGDRRDYDHSKRAIQRILSSVFTVTRWQGDTSFSTFRLARGQAGKIRPKVPACPRESKSSEFPVTSVTLSPRSRLLPRRKSKTYDAKVRDLRYESQGLMMQKSVAYEENYSDTCNHANMVVSFECSNHYMGAVIKNSRKSFKWYHPKSIRTGGSTDSHYSRWVWCSFAAYLWNRSSWCVSWDIPQFLYRIEGLWLLHQVRLYYWHY